MRVHDRVGSRLSRLPPCPLNEALPPTLIILPPRLTNVDDVPLVTDRLPTIVSMSEELEQIRELELNKTLAAMPDLSDAQRKEVEQLTRRIVRTILQRPMVNIKQEIGHHDPHTVLHLVKRLFGIEETTGQLQP